MSKDIWVCSDHHFGDTKISNYLNDNKKKNRPYSSLDQMHEDIIEKHNSVVKQGNKVWMLGDAVIDKHYFPLLSRLNGSLRITLGNHDIFPEYYPKYFKRIEGVKVIADRKVIMTHIPIHSASLKEGWVNIHGHTHSRKIDDPRYICVCLEHINYTPINLDELLKR